MTVCSDRAYGRTVPVIASAARYLFSSLLARRLILLLGIVAAGGLEAACLRLASHPDGKVLAQFEVRDAAPTFTIGYVHSVTRTPVEERYRIEGTTIVQTEVRFAQHGPGLPTQADAGGAWRQEQGRYVVTTDRRFESIALRVHEDQAWRLVVAGDRRNANLAQWGNRAIALSASAAPCLTGPTGYGARAQ